MARHTALGPAHPLSGRTERDVQAVVDDLAPDALVAVADESGAMWLSNPRLLLWSLAQEGGGRRLRNARVFRGADQHGIVVDVAGRLSELRARVQATALPDARRGELLARLDGLLHLHHGGLDHRDWRAWGPRLESRALGLPDNAAAELAVWTGGGWMPLPVEGALPEGGLAVCVPGLGPPPSRAFRAFAAAWSDGPCLLFKRRLLTATAAELADALGRLVPPNLLARAHVVAHSTGGLLTEMTWHRLFSTPDMPVPVGSYVAVHAPLGGSPMLHPVQRGLTRWLEALHGAAELGAVLDGVGRVGARVGLVDGVADALLSTVLLALLRSVDRGDDLTGLAHIGLDAAPAGWPSWRRLLSDNEQVRAGSPLLRERHRWMGHSAEGSLLPGHADDRLVLLHAMRNGFPEGSRLVAQAGTRTHFDVLDSPAVVRSLVATTAPRPTPVALPGRLCPELVQELARRRGLDDAPPAELARQLGLEAPVADREGGFHLGRPEPGLSGEDGLLGDVFAKRVQLPPPAPFDDGLSPELPSPDAGLLHYAQLHRMRYNPRWQPQEVEPAWCGIGGARSRRLIVPADATSPLWGLQERLGLSVTAADRHRLRQGRICRLPPSDGGVEVVLVPTDPARDFLLDAWRGRVREAVTALLLGDPALRRDLGRPSEDAISVFLPNPMPQAPVRALAVAAVEGAILGRQDAWRELSAGAETPADRAVALLPFRLRLAVTWKDDYLELADALARAPELSAMVGLPRILPRSLAGQVLAGAGHAGGRPIPLVARQSSLKLTVARIETTLWRFTAMTGRGLLRLEHRVTPEMVDFMASEARASRRGPALTWLAILPPEVRRLLRSALNVEFVLDEHTERVPWEALCVDGAPLCIRGSVSRRARSWRDPAPRQEDAVLVVANPTGDLAGASGEGVVVAGLFDGLLAQPAELDQQPPGVPHPRPDVLKHRILTGAHRVVHIASHGRSGAVVLGSTPGGVEVLLAADDVRRAGHVPELVVLNCCSVEGDDFERSNLARAFRDRGCRVVVGTGWGIDDRAGQAFAHALYDGLLSGETIAEAAFQARLAVRSEHGDLSDAHWTAYRIWGDPEWQLTVGSVGEPRLRRRDIDRIVTEDQAIDACITLMGMLRSRGEAKAGASVRQIVQNTLLPALLDRMTRVSLPVAANGHRVCEGLASAELSRRLRALLAVVEA